MFRVCLSLCVCVYLEHNLWMRAHFINKNSNCLCSSVLSARCNESVFFCLCESKFVHPLNCVTVLVDREPRDHNNNNDNN